MALIVITSYSIHYTKLYDKPIEIKLNEEEKNALKKLDKGHNTGQQIAVRARIVLVAGEGKNNSQIVRELGVSMNTVRLWRSRWALFQPVPLTELSAQVV